MGSTTRVPKLGSIHHRFAEKKERLLSMKGSYSQIGIGIALPESDEDDPSPARRCCSYRAFFDEIVGAWYKAKRVGAKAWEMGRADPRKIVFSAKMGLALILISLLIFLKITFEDPFEDISRYSIWAILTVVVVFEFSIGATLSKGLNRALGTLTAGGLAFGSAALSKLAGRYEEFIVMISIFIAGFCATYAKQYPTMKAYEYGFRVFLITYCYIIVLAYQTGSRYQTGEFVETPIDRFLLIALGAAVSLGVNVCIYPIWAGEDLHDLVVKNFMGVATSLEGVVNNYLNCIEYETMHSKILTNQAAEDVVYSGYKSAVESTSKEDALMGFAVWEPPHGRYKMFRYPWQNYVKVSGALRHCAFMVMAMHGCILSEIQAPAGKRQVFRRELQKVGYEGAKILRELGNKVEKMEKLGQEDILYKVHEAAEELQQKIDKKSFLLVNSESWEIGNQPRKECDPQDLLNIDEERHFLEYKSLSEAVLDLRTVKVSESWEEQASPDTKPAVSASAADENMFRKQVSWPAHISFKADAVTKEEESRTYESASSLSLGTFTSLLIEFVARLQNLVDSFEELGEKAKFKDPLQQERANSCGYWNRFFNCLIPND